MQAIVAVTENWGIGKDGQLLFHIKDDLRRFKKLTMGHTVVMGRRTLESLPGGKGLPGRRNVVLTTDKTFAAPGAEVVHTPLAALFSAGLEDFCIGGERTYRTLLPSCDKVFVTKIYETVPADAFFPDLDADPEWKISYASPMKEENGVKYRFVNYVRRENDPYAFCR